MISVTNVPPVLDSQVYSPTVAAQVGAVQSITAQPLLFARFSKLQSSISRDASSKSHTNPKMLVKSISLWAAGASRDLKLDLPLLTVLKAENPRSVSTAPTAVSHLADSNPVKIEGRSENSVAAKEVENKGVTSVEESSLSVAETDNKNCLAADEMLPKAAFPNVFQVQVKGHPIAYLPTQAAAATLEQQINQLLRMPRFDPNILRPAIVNGVPVGKAADMVLFEITPDLAASFDRNPTLLAIAWINQLRVTLGAEPIALAEAQSQMYHLLPSNKQIKGNASWYDPSFEGSPTATGETFDSSDLTAAHPSLPFGTYLKVTNQQNSDSVIVRINDRGPYLTGRSLDISGEAARCLNSQASGVVPFRAVIMESPSRQAASPETSPAASQAIAP